MTAPANSFDSWTDAGITSQFRQTGFVIIRQAAPPALVDTLRQTADEQLQRGIEPIEYEAEVGYAGAPESRQAPGGRTPRRLKWALARHPAFITWAQHPPLVSTLRNLIQQQVVLVTAHHNCVMAKDPRYSSDTGWHRDLRYWRYARPELISVQLLLDQATPESGALHFLPGSHLRTYHNHRFDADEFLRDDHPDNLAEFPQSVSAELQMGDVVLFHCQVFHRATRNRGGAPARSVILTYRPLDNPPQPGTRSAASPEIYLPEP